MARVSKSSRRRSVAQEIIAGLREVEKDLRGESADLISYEVRLPDVRALRRRLNLTQTEFARRFHLNKRTVQDWEQGRVRPDPAVRAYLTVIERDPKAVVRALGRS